MCGVDVRQFGESRWRECSALLYDRWCNCMLLALTQFLDWFGTGESLFLWHYGRAFLLTFFFLLLEI